MFTLYCFYSLYIIPVHSTFFSVHSTLLLFSLHCSCSLYIVSFHYTLLLFTLHWFYSLYIAPVHIALFLFTLHCSCSHYIAPVHSVWILKDNLATDSGEYLCTNCLIFYFVFNPKWWFEKEFALSRLSCTVMQYRMVVSQMIMQHTSKFLLCCCWLCDWRSWCMFHIRKVRRVE